MALNSMHFQGRLVRDVETKFLGADAIEMCEFTLAWSEKYKEKETKCFLRCKAFRGTAKFIGDYFKQGDELIIEGRMVTEEWETNGEKKNRTICNVDKAHFGAKKQGAEPGSRPTPSQARSDGFMDIPDGIGDELPFN